MSELAKIKAVHDQETWVEVDVPDVYQAILTSLFCSEPLTTGNVNDGQGNAATGYIEVASSNDVNGLLNSQ